MLGVIIIWVIGCGMFERCWRVCIHTQYLSFSFLAFFKFYFLSELYYDFVVVDNNVQYGELVNSYGVWRYLRVTYYVTEHWIAMVRW